MQRFLFIISLLLIISCSQSDSKLEKYYTMQGKIGRVYPLKTTPREGEWLYTHKEKYQSFDDYIASKPSRIDSVRNKIYITRIGNFDKTESEIIDKTKTYLNAFYGLEIKEIDLKNIDFNKNSRENNLGKQLYTPVILNEVLKPNLPKDAVVFIALTNIDLYPDPKWNFVFGQASLKNRVGVWSIRRFGNPAKDAEAYKFALLRTVNTATHEIGHMFSITHCTKFECCMNGSNGEEEHNSRPPYFCPECLNKICWNLNREHKEHFKEISNFWKKEGFKNNADFYSKNLSKL